VHTETLHSQLCLLHQWHIFVCEGYHPLAGFGGAFLCRVRTRWEVPGMRYRSVMTRLKSRVPHPGFVIFPTLAHCKLRSLITYYHGVDAFTVVSSCVPNFQIVPSDHYKSRYCHYKPRSQSGSDTQGHLMGVTPWFFTNLAAAAKTHYDNAQNSNEFIFDSTGHHPGHRDGLPPSQHSNTRGLVLAFPTQMHLMHIRLHLLAMATPSLMLSPRTG
jgi:hypothetical protein